MRAMQKEPSPTIDKDSMPRARSTCPIYAEKRRARAEHDIVPAGPSATAWPPTCAMRHLLKNPQRSSAVKVASTQVIKSAMGPPDQKYQIAGRIVLDGSGRLAQINGLDPVMFSHASRMLTTASGAIRPPWCQAGQARSRRARAGSRATARPADRRTRARIAFAPPPSVFERAGNARRRPWSAAIS